MWDRDRDETGAPPDRETRESVRARQPVVVDVARLSRCAARFPALMDVRLSRHRKPEHAFEWDRPRFT